MRVEFVTQASLVVAKTFVLYCRSDKMDCPHTRTQAVIRELGESGSVDMMTIY